MIPMSDLAAGGAPLARAAATRPVDETYVTTMPMNRSSMRVWEALRRGFFKCSGEGV